MAQRWQGTGESGVRLPDGITRDIYQSEWMPSQLNSLCQELAQKANVSLPHLEIQDGGTKRSWGSYKAKTIHLYRRWPGVLIHEFAHHIVKERFPRAQAHGPEFWDMCEAAWSLSKGTVLAASGIVTYRIIDGERVFL